MKTERMKHDQLIDTLRKQRDELHTLAAEATKLAGQMTADLNEAARMEYFSEVQQGFLRSSSTVIFLRISRISESVSSIMGRAIEWGRQYNELEGPAFRLAMKEGKAFTRLPVVNLIKGGKNEG